MQGAGCDEGVIQGVERKRNGERVLGKAAGGLEERRVSSTWSTDVWGRRNGPLAAVSLVQANASVFEWPYVAISGIVMSER